jgi:hypothetical protein
VLRPISIVLRLYRLVLIRLQPAVLAALCLFVSLAGSPAAEAQVVPPSQEQAAEPPVSLDRIREGVARTPALKLEQKQPTPTFRTTTEGRRLMLPFHEYLRKELELTPLQRQSADWASRCCGIDLGQVFKGVGKAWGRRKARHLRERIGQELADLETLRAASGDTVK